MACNNRPQYRLATRIVFGLVMAAGSPAAAQDYRPNAIKELPLAAQYCAILRALSSRDDPRCPASSIPIGETRGLVITGGAGAAVPDPGLPRTMIDKTSNAAVAVDYTSAYRSFSHNALPAVGNPGDAGYFIQFAFDSAALGTDFKAHLARLAEVLETEIMAQSCIRVVGHTDTVGSPKYNAGLSDLRAISVRNYLTITMGLADIRVGYEGKGETMPLDDVPGGHPKNRRVEILSRDLALGCS